MISFIWAMDKNQLIGNNNKLPWHLPADLQYFKKVTMGKPIVMGRKTFESIGRILPGRENIILTRNLSYKQEGCHIFYKTEDFITYAKAREDVEFFVIGGAQIFNELYNYAERLYITKIYDEFTGDTYFPPINMTDWKLIRQEKGIKDDKNPYDYEFLVYERT